MSTRPRNNSAAKGKKEYPFRVTTIIPKGTKLSKNKAVIRNRYYKTREEAQRDADSWVNAGFTSGVFER